jgi:N-acetyl-gamma-glutamyl-phosphate reductase
VIRTAILGGSGYGGMELLRLLLGHPSVTVTALTSRTEEGEVAARHPHLAGFTPLRFTKETPEVRLRLAEENDLLFWAKPHAVAAREVPEVLAARPTLRVVDLSGDFRLVDAAAYPPWYEFEHPHPSWLGRAVYGLPECGLRDRISTAQLVANPGCHASAAVLAVWPFARAGLVKGRVSVSSVTGSSGSGATPKAGTHHPERFANFRAYKPLDHQHLPEVLQALGGGVEVDFVPHSAPLARGIHVTAFVPTGSATREEVLGALATAYEGEPFVRFGEGTVEVRASMGTNMVDLGVTVGRGVTVVTLALDNLGKGMAGTAVQNLNLMFGLPESAALDRPGAGL